LPGHRVRQAADFLPYVFDLRVFLVIHADSS
jgi:hypothetical protein